VLFIKILNSNFDHAPRQFFPEQHLSTLQNTINDGETQSKEDKMAPKKKKGWRYCATKKLLSEDILSGAIPEDMHWHDVYWQRPEYAESKWDLFAGRLDSLRQQISHAKDRNTTEEAALVHDRALFPIPTHNHRGEPRWDGSEAQRLLKEDVAAGIHETMKPQQLYQTHPQYNDYSLAVFRGHLYQEVRFVKFCTWRNETGVKKTTDWM
jgi:hypothetical protein